MIWPYGAPCQLARLSHNVIVFIYSFSREMGLDPTVLLCNKIYVTMTMVHYMRVVPLPVLFACFASTQGITFLTAEMQPGAVPSSRIFVNGLSYIMFGISLYYK